MGGRKREGKGGAKTRCIKTMNRIKKSLGIHFDGSTLLRLIVDNHAENSEIRSFIPVYYFTSASIFAQTHFKFQYVLTF